MSIVEVFLLFMLYFVPVIVAFGRGHTRRWLLTAVCVFTAWTVLGWVLVLVWAIVGKGKKQEALERERQEQIRDLERDLQVANTALRVMNGKDA